MKKHALILICLLGMSFINSCQKSEDAKVDRAVANDKLKITLKAVFDHNDKLQLFYSDDDIFIEDKSIRVVAYGQSVMQDIVFELPQKEKPTHFRFDFGENEEQNEFTIKNIIFEWNGKVIGLDDESFKNFFNMNANVSYNPIKLCYELKKNDEGVFDPFVYSNEVLIEEVTKLYTNTITEETK